MIGTVEVTVKVYLNSDIEAEGEAIREIVDAVVAGDTHPNIAETELGEFDPGPENN
jgi:hypothetical protein